MCIRDSSELGAVDAEAFARRHQLPAWDSALIVWLVPVSYTHLLPGPERDHRTDEQRKGATVEQEKPTQGDGQQHQRRDDSLLEH